MKFYFLFFCACFLLLGSTASALQITEIHFDPPGSDTDREWIEVFNGTPSQIDLTEIKFFEANVNHGIDIFNQPNSTEKGILAGEYAVVVQDIGKFKIDFPGYVGKIFKASFSLSNTGEVLSLKDKDGNILYTVTYSESDKQKIPSPGQPNSGGTVLPTTSNSTTTSTSTSTTTNQNSSNIPDSTPNYFYRSYWPETEKIFVKAGENKVVMQGQNVFFDPKVLDGNKKQINSTGGSIQYKWNFGDGYTSDKKEAQHSYKFIGEFVVNLQVNYNGYVDEDRIYIKVVEPKLTVKITEKDFENNQKADVVEIKNENNFELDVGNLEIINEQNKKFLVPEKSIIMGGRSVYLEPGLTGFSSSTQKVSLGLLQGKILSSFEKLTVPTVEVLVSSSTVATTTTGAILKPKKVIKNFNKTSLLATKESKPLSVSTTTKIEFKNDFSLSDKYKSNETLFARFKKLFGI